MKHGVVMCAPDDSRVIQKMVCYDYTNAKLRGKEWKRRHPENIVRLVSLMPGDWSVEDVPLPRPRHNFKRDPR